MAESGLPGGGDIGVESVGFVPPKLGRHGAAYLAIWEPRARQRAVRTAC
jgi:hypothetical protein